VRTEVESSTSFWMPRSRRSRCLQKNTQEQSSVRAWSRLSSDLFEQQQHLNLGVVVKLVQMPTKRDRTAASKRCDQGLKSCSA
jgi:hypothetical protein